MSKSPRSRRRSRSLQSRSLNRAASRSPEGARGYAPDGDPIPGTSLGDASQAPSPAGAAGPSLRSDDQPVQQRRAEAVYRRRREDIVVRNFAYKIHNLIKSIKVKFWHKQCLIGFSPRINEGEKFQLIWESTMNYLAALEGIKTLISESTFEENLDVLQYNYDILKPVLAESKALFKWFEKAIQDDKFVHSADFRGAYGPKRPRFTTVTENAAVEDLIIHHNIIGMYEVTEELHKLLSSIFNFYRSHRIFSLSEKITHLIETANARLQRMASTDRWKEPSPPRVVFDPNETETKSILRSDRQFSPKRISVGPVHRRYVAINTATGKDVEEEDTDADVDDNGARPTKKIIAEQAYETLEDFQNIRADERRRAAEVEGQRRLDHYSLQAMNRRMGRPQTPFKPRRVRHIPKRAVDKDQFTSGLTEGYPNPRTVIWTSPPPSPKRSVEAEEDGNEDEDTPGHDSHNVLRPKRRCRPRNDEWFDSLRPTKRHRRAA